MASAKQQENMLLTEHFTWPPISLIDDIINAVNEVLYRCTDSFETGLCAADPALLGFADRYEAEKRTPARDEDGNHVYEEAKLEIEEGVLKLETLMENAVDKNFDKLEIWTLRNVLCLGRGEEDLASWVRLGGYENLQFPPKDPNLTPEALYTLRRKLIETQKLNAALVAEKKRNEAQIARLRELLQPTPTPKREARTSTSPTKTSEGDTTNGSGPFAFLTHTPAAQSLGIQPLPLTGSTTTNADKNTPLTTHTTFTTSQVPYLRQLLASLKPHLATTALPSNTSNSTEAQTEQLGRERKLYVESQSKRILERRGIDTKDGVEGVWEGSSVRAEEVRGLEGLVEGLGRRVGKKDADGEVEEDTGAGAKDDGDAMDIS
ncbi:Mis12 domain-containing protein [Decorospora gaudefroyi]|uniref:Mis12 domain-containing protein n=1 Tax=Decorospora gaudefroyi TaxID=184978 RepID=A0A6A5K9W8_9PLEO|nr:Mis12 domain-containing protein [Decorospora gaudefroyi]